MGVSENKGYLILGSLGDSFKGFRGLGFRGSFKRSIWEFPKLGYLILGSL